MRTITDFDLTVLAFDANVWQQERNVIHCTIAEQPDESYTNYWVRLYIGSTLVAVYYIASDWSVDIDMTDYIRSIGSGAVRLAADGSSQILGEVELTWTVVGNLPPRALFVPDTPEAAAIRATVHTDYNYLLPNSIIKPFGVAAQYEVYGANSAYFEKSTGALKPHAYYAHVVLVYAGTARVTKEDAVLLVRAIYTPLGISMPSKDYVNKRLTWNEADRTADYAFDDVPRVSQALAEADIDTIEEVLTGPLASWSVLSSEVIDAGNAETTDTAISADLAELSIPTTADMVGIAMPGTKELVQSIRLQTRHCNRQYAMVEWLSQTGKTKRAAWELREHKVGVGETVDLMQLTGEARQARGREDGVTLRMECLTAFDVWYYGDIVTSSRVRVSLDGTNYRTVQVDSKSVSVPDGDGEVTELKVNIIYAEYDAIIV